jgi:ankyrin repeat protein
MVAIHIHTHTMVNLTTPLINAVKGDHIEAARLLLEHGACVTQTVSDEYALRCYGINYCPYSYAQTAVMMKLLIDHGANIYSANWYDHLRDDGGISYSQFHDLCEYDSNIDKVRVLIDAGVDIDRDNNDGCFEYSTPLDRAASHNAIDVMRLLIERGVSKDNISRALHSACSTEAAQLLIDNGASIHHLNNYTYTYDGSYPIENRSGEIKDLLSYYESLIKERVDRGEGTIHEATHVGNLDMIKKHLNDGIDINSIDNDRCTPLHIAAKRQYIDIALYLLDHGADKRLCINGKIPYDLLSWDHDSYKKDDDYKRLYDDLYIKCNDRLLI